METPLHYWLSRSRELFLEQKSSLSTAALPGTSLKANAVTCTSIPALLFSHKQVHFDGPQLPATPGDDLNVLHTYLCSEKNQHIETETIDCPVQQEQPKPCRYQTTACTERCLYSILPFMFPPYKVKLPISASWWPILFSENWTTEQYY